MCVSSGRLWNRTSRWERLGWIWYAATDVRLGWVFVKFERLDWEWLVAMCRDHLCFERVLVEWSVFAGDDALDVCLEWVLVHVGASHVTLWKTGPAHPK